MAHHWLMPQHRLSAISGTNPAQWAIAVASLVLPPGLSATGTPLSPQIHVPLKNDADRKGAASVNDGIGLLNPLLYP